MLMNVLPQARTTVTLTQPAPTQLEVLHVLVIRGMLVVELHVQASVFFEIRKRMSDFPSFPFSFSFLFLFLFLLPRFLIFWENLLEVKFFRFTYREGKNLSTRVIFKTCTDSFFILHRVLVIYVNFSSIVNLSLVSEEPLLQLKRAKSRKKDLILGLFLPFLF